MVLLRLLAFRPAGKGAAVAPSTTPPTPHTSTAKPVANTASAARVEPPAARRELLRPSTEFRAAPVAPAVPVAPPKAPVVEEPPPWVEANEPDWVRDEAVAVAPPPVKSEPQPEPEPEAATRVAQLTFERTPQQDRWMAAMDALFERGAVAGLVRELAWQAQCIGCDEVDGQTVWRLKVERESLRQASHRERLQAALVSVLDRPQRLEVEAGVAIDSAARRDNAAKALRQAEAEDLIQADPVVRQLLAAYPSARIVPGSIRPR